MYLNYANSFVDPYELAELSFHVFKREGELVQDGMFVHLPSNRIYPVVDGVPIFIQNRVFVSFWETYKNQIVAIVPDEEAIKKQLIARPESFSFSNEWEAAHNDKVDTIWGRTIEERLQVHYDDTESTEAELKGQIVLDVGCGNGILCKTLAEKGATVFGIDYSTSVWNAEKAMQHPNVCYLQADLHHLPFKDKRFDVVYSNGVLHHTPNTEHAFKRVATKVKAGGKYYVWLYARGTTFGFNAFLYITDFMRFVTNKLPHFAQKMIIETLLFLKIVYCTLRGKKYDVGNVRTDLYDTLTPQYKFYHTEKETISWFEEYGFENSKQTHLNLYGFGVLGIKK